MSDSDAAPDTSALEAATAALARAWNRLDPDEVAPWLAEGVRYGSVDTDLVLEGRGEVLEHLRGKMGRIGEVGEAARIRAEIGHLPAAGGRTRPCVISTQGDRGVPVLFMVWLDDENRIARVELVTTDPDPRSAVGSGLIPD
jgi:hypothetical protein